jgi:hypothetical protein
MNIITAGFILLLIIVLIISVIFFLHSHASLKDKTILISIRIILIIAIALAFFEPELTLDKLSTTKRTVALLIDNSRSMTGFSPEQTVITPVNRILKSASGNKKVSVKAFTFGDSLQPHSRFDQKAFSATKSEFPDLSKGELIGVDDIIIISDAYWSSSTARINKLSERHVYYLPLNNIAPKSHIAAESSYIDSSAQKNHSTFKTILSGFLTKKEICTLTVTDNNRLFKSKTITLDSGSIDSTILFQVANKITGKHLFKTTLVNKDSTLPAQDFSVVTIPPKQFTYALHSAVPSLDQRFFTLALKKHPEFLKTSPQLADLSIFTGSMNDLQSLIDKTQPKSVCAFIGVSQCGDSFSTVSDHSKIVQNQSFIPPVPFTIPLTDLPPPSALPSCSPHLMHASAILYLTNNNSIVQYPLISIGNFSGRSALQVSFQGLWRWDFWPMSSSRGEEEPFLFSDYVIALCKEMIIAKTGSDLFAYPEFDKSDDDSLVFAVSLPSELPLSQPVSLELRVGSFSGKPIHLSTSKLTTTGSLQYIKTPFPHDTIICYDIAFNYATKQFRYQDCIINQYKDRELLVDNQNTSLLNQFAQPLEFDSDSAVNAFFTNMSTEPKPLIKQVLSLKRTWWLIALILILFSVEWYLRKRIE